MILLFIQNLRWITLLSNPSSQFYSVLLVLL
jgi:hypothetical protein